MIKKFKEELNKLWIHGLIHLFGHEHKKYKDYKAMRRLEKNISITLIKC